MANWTHNIVTITGDKKEIDSLFAYVKMENTEENQTDDEEIEVFSLNRIYPMPPSLMISEDVPEDEAKLLCEVNKRVWGAKDWYEWRLENWGTKWEVSGAEYERESDEKLVYTFDTAWSAPENIANELREIFPDLKIKWEALNEEDIERDDGYCDLDWEDQSKKYEI